MRNSGGALDELTHPRLAGHVHVEVLARDHAVVLGEGGHTILPGRVYAQLLGLLDGTRSVGELMVRLDGVVSPPEVAYALARLRAEGLAVEGPPSADLAPAREAFWNALGLDGACALRRIAQRPVATRGLADAPVQALRVALAADGVTLADGAALLVVATDDYLRPELATINRDALASGQPWLLARLTGRAAWIGPLFEPGTTGCWECLAQRLRANRQAERFLVQARGRAWPFATGAAALASTVEAAAALVATQALRWLATGSSALEGGRVVTLGVAGEPSRRHELVRRPQCRACGAPGPSGSPGPRAGDHHHDDEVRVRLHPAPTGSTGDARTASADELLERFGHHVSPITGVVSELKDPPRSEAALGYTCNAVHDFPMFREDMGVLRHNLYGRSGGKATTRAGARAGALGEAIERYSCMWRGEEERTLVASAAQLGERAVDLAACLGFSAAQVAGREHWNRTLANPHQVVPAPLRSDLAVSWTPLWSLTHEHVRYLPSAYCYYGHPDMEHFFCLGDSNGCASGSTLEEAIYHALMELVERDAVAIWWYNRLRQPAVATDAVDVPFHAQLRDRLRAEQRDLWLLDLTCDTATPTFAAISAREHAVEDVLLGFAADLDAATAIERALTELAQSHSQVARRRANGDTAYATSDRDTLHWLRTATRATHQYLVPAADRAAVDLRDETPALHADPVAAADAPSVAPRDHAPAPHADLRDDVREVVRRLEALGLEVLVLDQTRPDVGMPVCRVVVPGLCHFWRRLGFERLSGVPVRDGRLAAPHAEADLNPLSVFF